MATLTQLDQIEAAIASRFRAIAIQSLAATGRAARARFGALPGTTISAVNLKFGRPFSCRSSEPLDFLPIQLPLAGFADVRCGAHGFQSGPDIGISPGLDEPFGMRTSADWHFGVVRLDMEQVKEELRGLLGYWPDAPVRMHPLLDLSTPGGRQLKALLFGVLQSTTMSGVTHMPTASARQLEGDLARALLQSQRHNYSAVLARITDVAPLAVVRKAQDFLESDPGQSISVTSLAVDLNTSVRSLTRGFRHYLDTTPTAYLKELRLQTARTALLEQRDGDSVTQIALRCGFSHLSRFAVLYKARFGESPSSTLRAVRRFSAAGARIVS